MATGQMRLDGRQPTVVLDDAAIIALGEATMARRFSCGHPRIGENMLVVDGAVGVRCAICARRIDAASAGGQV